MHGTSETPAFVGTVACHAAEAGREVIVGLEIPNSMQRQVDRFLHSNGTASDVDALLQGQFWTYPDGRSSKAMLALINQVRLLIAAGKPVSILLFDGLFFLDQQRDAGMATNIAAGLATAPQAVALMLVGNLHAQADSDRWMAWHLAKRYPQLRSLNVAYSGGRAWVCMADDECGPNELAGPDRGKAQFVEIFDGSDRDGYRGSFYVGAVTASPPATQQDDVPSLQAKPSSEALLPRRQGQTDPQWRVPLVAAGTKVAQAGANQELAQIYRDDQGDRHGNTDEIDWSIVGQRDIARRKRVRAILAANGAKVAADYYHAAMVFQHGSEPDDYQMAHELAVKAAELDPNDKTAKWLAAAAKDRLLMTSDQPQMYGTQFTMMDGRWQLYRVDPNVTDAERAKWNVPPLAEAKQRVEEMNRK